METAYQIINISLPHQTLERIDRVAAHGSRSRLIDQAITFYFADRSREQLRKALQQGAIDHAGRDRKIAAEMFTLHDTWSDR